MDMLHGLGTAVFFALGWLTGIGIGVVVLSFALRPLDVPIARREGSSWEWTIASLFALLYFHLWGLILIAVIALVLIVDAGRRRRKQGANIAKKPFFPQIALGELIAMVLSIGCAPLAFALLYLEPVADVSVIVIGAAVILFPIAVLRAIDRLNGNDVPVCAARTLFIFLFPHMIYSCLFLCARSAIVLLFVVIGASRDLDGMGPNYVPRLLLRISIAVVIFGAGVALAYWAKSKAPTAG
jgi:hypothetical protein